MINLTFLLIGGCSNAAPRQHGDAGPTQAASVGAVWESPERCAAAVQGGLRLAREPERVRVASWNVHWFPDGKPGNVPRLDKATDVAWLACALTYLDADVIALQEVKLTERGVAALADLLAGLRQGEGSDWRYVTDQCSVPSKQHLAFLYRNDRIELSHVASHDELDPTRRNDAKPCSGDLRPALGVYVRSRSGGLDAHLLTVHLDSGTEARDYEHRRSQWQSLTEISARRQGLVADTDVLVVGDFNLMGCKKCEVDSAEAELAQFNEALQALSTPFSSPGTSERCTQYYKGKGSLIDKTAHTASMREAEGVIERVSGVCGGSQCAPLRDVQALKQLSDHCPLVVDLRDEDLD